jgi:hypothetical protein
MKYLLLASFLALSVAAVPAVAQQTTMTKAEIKAAMKAEKVKQKAEKERSKSTAVVVVTAPAPVVTPAPAPTPVVVVPAPTSTITPYMQAQIDAALARPQSFNCTYCAAFAASQGDLATVEAIGAGTYMNTPTTVTQPAEATSQPAPVTEAASEPATQAPSEPAAATEVTQ